MNKLIKVFNFNNNKINIYGTFDKPLFIANEIGEILGIKNIRDTLRNMPKEYKNKMDVDFSDTPQKVNIVNESGLYYIIMRSNKDIAVLFQKWILENVLPSIRKTGEYVNNPQTKIITKFNINTEDDLHKKVINFIHNHFPNILCNATLGENQINDTLRINSKLKGYQAGMPDLIIYNQTKKYNGFVIEFKSPTGLGVLSDKQNIILNQFNKLKYKVLLSNDYDEIIININKYCENLCKICLDCNKKYINEKAFIKHCVKHYYN